MRQYVITVSGEDEQTFVETYSDEEISTIRSFADKLDSTSPRGAAPGVSITITP